MRIFIVGFPDRFEKEDLRKMFGVYGAVKSVVINKRWMLGGSKFFGFVEMDQKEAAMKAIQSLNKSMLKGKQLLVTKARLGN